MARVIALANQKGGVGKTTTTRNVGDALVEVGKRVLLVDLDQQGSLSAYCGVNTEKLEVSIYNIFASYIDLNRTPLPLEPILIHLKPGLDLVAANEELAALDLELIGAYQREEILKQMLAPLLANYDYILLDCPPNLSLLVVNALAAATEVIIILQTDYLATRGVNRLIKIVTAIQSRLNKTLLIDGILLTMADQRTRHTRQIIDATRERFQGKIRVFETITKMAVTLKDAPATGKSILEFDGSGEAAQSFRSLATEVSGLFEESR